MSTRSGSEAISNWLSYLAAAAAMLFWDDKTMHRISILQMTAARGLGALTMLPGALNTLAHVLSFEGDLDGAASAIAEANEVIEATGGNVSWAGAVVAGWRGDASAVTLFDELVTHGRAAGNALAVKSALWGSARYHNGIARVRESTH